MRFVSPNEVVAACPEFQGAKVADLGSGIGYYSRALLNTARGVVSVDINPLLVHSLARSVPHVYKDRLRVVQGDVRLPHGSRIKSGSIDMALISNVLYEVDNREAFLSEARRTLTPTGHLLLVDWADAFAGIGPHWSQVISYKEARPLLERAGFKIVRDLGAATGAYHYGLLARRMSL